MHSAFCRSSLWMHAHRGIEEFTALVDSFFFYDPNG